MTPTEPQWWPDKCPVCGDAVTVAHGRHDWACVRADCTHGHGHEPNGAPLERIELDRMTPRPRQELLARDRATRRIVSIECPAAWSKAEVCERIGPDYEPTLWGV